MKTKKLGKKLVLNKKTIAHLGSGMLSAARGGFHPPYNTIFETCSCVTCGELPTCDGKTCMTICETCVSGDPCVACEL